MCTLLTQKFCFMCIMQYLSLAGNKIGDAGMISLADALGKGALDKLRVSWSPTAFSPCPETTLVHSSDSKDLFDVPYAGAYA